MTFTTRRPAALATALATLFSLALAAPASAQAPPACIQLPNVPAEDVDVDGDGIPDVRMPLVSNIGLCVGADVVLTESPSIDREQCGGFGSCMAYYVSYGLAGYVDTNVTFCFTIGEHANCAVSKVPRVPIHSIAPAGTMCFGWDLRGGFPCPNGGPIDFGG